MGNNRELSNSPMPGGNGRRRPSVLAQVEAWLNGHYPGTYTPRIIAQETGLDYEGVKKAVQNLVKKGRADRPLGVKRGFYRGVPSVTNVSALEDPPIKMHNITLQITPIGNKSGGPPPPLYTNGERHKTGTIARAYNKGDGAGSWYEAVEYWANEGTPIKVIIQFYPQVIVIHINATLKPIMEVQITPLMAWVQGITQAYGVNNAGVQVDIIKAELNKDYELITITPTMLEIRDLTSKSWLRLYRKMRNLHRLEIGTTYQGDLKLLDMFKKFGKPNFYETQDDDKRGYA